MNFYERELQTFRPDDTINEKDWFSQRTREDGLYFIDTASHGYLVVPTEHPRYKEAKKIAKYGYKGEHAVYLEEDCEAPEFMRIIKK